MLKCTFDLSLCLVCFTALGSSIGVVVVVFLTLCLCCLGPKKEIFDDAVSMPTSHYFINP